jgi:hypothetical protein
VFITNCHVSLNPNIGPLMPHKISASKAAVNTHGRPSIAAAPVENLVKMSGFFLLAIANLLYERHFGGTSLAFPWTYFQPATIGTLANHSRPSSIYPV